MVSPIVAWIVVLVAIVVSSLIWILGTPIVTAMYAASNGLIPEELQGPATTMRLLWIVIPIVLDVGLVVWAFLVTTRRQIVTRPMERY